MKASLRYLQVLSTAKPRLQKMMIDQSPKNVIDAPCECSLNALEGVIPLTSHQKSCLSRYKTQLCVLHVCKTRVLAKGIIYQKQKRKSSTKKVKVRD